MDMRKKINRLHLYDYPSKDACLYQNIIVIYSYKFPRESNFCGLIIL